MHPASLLSYYPTYSLLDEVLSYNSECKQINFYFDLKNNLQSLYLEHAIINIVENSIKYNCPDTSVFSSVLSFLAFHKLYGIRRNIKVKFHIFYELGISYYHTNISKEYKISRRTDDLYGLDKERRNLFFKVLSQNYLLIEKAFQKMPNVKVIKLSNLEADFIPYYLIKSKLVENDSSISHIVYSNDHDLLQTLDAGNNIFVFQKNIKHKKLIKKGEAVKAYLKCSENYPDSFLPIIMTIIGDAGDNVKGVYGIGQKKVLLILDEFIGLVDGVDNLYENVYHNKPIFQRDKIEIKNKLINSIVKAEIETGLISKNLKLVSFEFLSRMLNQPLKTEMAERQIYIKKLIQETPTIIPLEAMSKALEMSKVFIQEDDLSTLYYQL